MPRPLEAMKVGESAGSLSLVLQTAAELPPAPLPSPAAGLEAEGPQLVPEGLVVHGPIVLGFTEGLGQDGRGQSIWGNGEWGMGNGGGGAALPSSLRVLPGQALPL